MKRAFLAALLVVGAASMAQAQAQVIQFTGLVVSGDSLVGVPDVRVGVPQTRRHTVTAPNGYFSLPVLAGDSIEVRTLTSTTHLHIPLDYQGASYSLLVQLQADTQPTALQVLPAKFSQQFLKLKLPPPATVETPLISAKDLLLLRPAYDRKGRRTN